MTDPEAQIDVKLTNSNIQVVSDETTTISTLRAKNTELENQITLLKASSCSSAVLITNKILIWHCLYNVQLLITICC